MNSHDSPFQIELDLLRTLPNNKHYDTPHADGVAKLRRVLLAYSVHSPEVEYCQVSMKRRVILHQVFLEGHEVTTPSFSRCQ